MTDPKTPAPLTEAEERELRDDVESSECMGYARFFLRLFATLDATRAQLASAQNAIVLTDADLQEERRKREASEEEYRQFRMSARAQLTAATERAERAEADTAYRGKLKALAGPERERDGG